MRLLLGIGRFGRSRSGRTTKQAKSYRRPTSFLGQRRRERALKRGAARVRGESVFQAPKGNKSGVQGLSCIADREPTPAFAALVRDEVKLVLASLEDADLRRIVIGKLEGRTNPEIAKLWNLSLRAVERKLRLIRRRWGEEREP